MPILQAKKYKLIRGTSEYKKDRKSLSVELKNKIDSFTKSLIDGSYDGTTHIEPVQTMSDVYKIRLSEGPRFAFKLIDCCKIKPLKAGTHDDVYSWLNRERRTIMGYT